MRAVLIQNLFGNWDSMLQVTEQHHIEYCRKHKFDYFVAMQPLTNGHYDRVNIFRVLLDRYDLLVYLDLDTFIAQDIDFREVPIKEDEIGVCYYLTPEPHYNTGALYVRPGKRVKEFVEKWWSLYPGYDRWHDQRIFNDIMNDCIVTLPDEWNSCHINPVEKPIVQAYHGTYSCYEEKLNKLKEGMNEMYKHNICV